MSPYRGSRKHNPDDVAISMDIQGVCGKCKHAGTAHLVAYYSGEVIIRCNHCKTAGSFEPEDKSYNDPHKFAPFIYENGEDDQQDDQGRYTRGKR